MSEFDKKLKQFLAIGQDVATELVKKTGEVARDLGKKGEAAFNTLKDKWNEAGITEELKAQAARLEKMADGLKDMTLEERDRLRELMDALDQDEKNAAEAPKPRFRMVHYNFNVKDLGKSLAFYEEALGLTIARKNEKEDFTLVYLTDGQSDFQLELTWLRDWPKDKYDLGDNEFHLAFETDDYEAAHALHEKMGVICYENPGMGIYFISDPDGYWLEVVPAK